MVLSLPGSNEEIVMGGLQCLEDLSLNVAEFVHCRQVGTLKFFVVKSRQWKGLDNKEGCGRELTYLRE